MARRRHPLRPRLRPASTGARRCIDSDDNSREEPHTRDLENPLAAVQMGLLYVNPEGPDGNPHQMASARDISDTFARMAMNESQETVALIAGGRPFGLTKSAQTTMYRIPMWAASRKRAISQQQGLGWKNSFGSGKGGDTITSGLEVTWVADTDEKWSNNFFKNLFNYEWELTKSPAGAHRWVAQSESQSISS